MSRKQDPIVAVLRYFESSNLALAEQGLALAREIVRKRQPQPTKKAKRTKVSRPAVDPLDFAPVAPPPQPPQPNLPPSVAATKARRRKAVAGTLSTPAVQQATEQGRSTASDLALPGLGPTTVGD